MLVKLSRHVLLGISGLSQDGGTALSIRGTEYELVELSPRDEKFPPGVISQYAMDELRNGRYEVELLN